MTKEQRDYLLLNPEKSSEIKKKIKEYGDYYAPKADWWPNKYSDM